MKDFRFSSVCLRLIKAWPTPLSILYVSGWYKDKRVTCPIISWDLTYPDNMNYDYED